MSNPSRAESIQGALRLEALTVGWIVIEAAVSISAAVVARSVLLAAFGIDSGIELVSAGALFWRLRREADATVDEGVVVQAAERRVARLSGYLLYALAAYVVAQSAYGLLHHHAAEASGWGLAVTAIAAVGMPLLARAQLRLADEIGSRALRADAMEALTCGYLSWLVLVGLAANALLHFWWLDSAAALLLVPWLVKEVEAPSPESPVFATRANETGFGLWRMRNAFERWSDSYRSTFV